MFERLLITCQHHRQTLEYIRAQNVPAARQAMPANIEYGRKNLKNVLNEGASKIFGNVEWITNPFY